MATVSIDLELLTKIFDKSLKKTVKETEKLGDAVVKSAKRGEKSMDKLAKSTTNASKGIKSSFGTAQIAVGSFLGSIVANAAVSALQAVGRAARASADNFLALQDAQIGVAKTTDLTEDELDSLTDSFIALSRRVPASTVELLKLGQVAGQLGVSGADNIALFSETITKLASASDLAGEEGAQSLIRILNVAGESVEEIDNLASAIVSLGNNFAATESEITRVATEVAKSTTQFKIGSANVVGISTALKALGQQAQLGGSVVGKTFRTISNAVVKGGKDLENFAKISKVSTEEFSKTFREDATEGFLLFIEGLNSLPAEQITLALESIGLKGDEVNKVLPVLAGRVDILKDALDNSNKAFVENTALNEEAEKAFASLSSKLTILGNNFLTLGTAIFGVFAPAMEHAVDLTNLFFDAFSSRTEIQEANDQIKIFSEQLAKLEGQDPTSELFKGNEKLRTVLRENISALKEFVLEQERANDASTNIVSTTGILENKLQQLNGQLATVKAGFGDAFGLNEADILSKIQKIKDEIAKVNAAPEIDTPDPKGLDTTRSQAVIDQEIKLQQELALIKQQAADEQILRDLQVKEANETATAEELILLQDFELLKINTILDAEETKARLITDSKLRTAKLAVIEQKRELAFIRQNNKNELESDRKLQQDKDAIRKSNLASASRFLQAGMLLSEKGSDAHKALSITDSLISTYTGATKAFAEVPYPANIAAAASITALGLANVAKIGNFEQGGIIPGSSFSGDNLTAGVNSGEMVLNRSQQSQLFNQANGGGGTSGSDMTAIVSAIQNIQITLQADDNEIARSVSRGVSNGVSIGESQ